MSRLVVELDAALIDQVKVHLMYQRRGLERRARGLAAQMAGGETPQLIVDNRQEGLECTLVAVAPLFE